MKFDTRYNDLEDRVYRATKFLEEAYNNKTICDIENIDELFEALDVAEDIAYLESKLKAYHLEY